MLRPFLLLLSAMLCCFCTAQAEAQITVPPEGLIISDASFDSENSFTATGDSLSILDVRSPDNAQAVGSGTLGSGDEGSAFNFNDSGDGALQVNFKNIMGAAKTGQATVINLYDDVDMRQSRGGTVTGRVKLNFRGESFQTFAGFYSVGQAGLDTSLVIGGDNSALSPDGDSATVVHIGDLRGGHDGKSTAIVAGGAEGGPDYLFSVENAIQDGSFAFYYNGTSASQGNALKIGASDKDTSVTIGGGNEQAAVRLTDLIGGQGGHSTSLEMNGEVGVTVGIARNTLNIINNNTAGEAVIVENMQDGVLNLGGAVATIVLKRVNSSGAGLEINSLDATRAVVEAAAQSISGQSKISLGNAALKLAEDGSGLNNLSEGSRFSMDSTKGDSILDASRVIGDFAFGLSQQPGIRVGGGGNVIIESNELSYRSALESAGGPAEIFDGRVSFEGAGGKRLIFLSHGLNNFEGGFKIDDSAANIEFVGSSFLNGFANAEKSRLAGHIYFTGLDGSADPLAASRFSFGNGLIDMGGGVLHLNNSLTMLQAEGHGLGGLERVAGLILGDGAGRDGGAAASITLLDVVLSADRAAVGPLGARLNAAVAVGGYSVMESSLNILDTLTIGGKTVIDGHLGTLAKGAAAFHFTARESIALTDKAKFSYIDPGTIFTIDQALAEQLHDSGEAFSIFEAAEEATEISPLLLASLAANLTFEADGLDVDGFFDLNPFTGTLSHSQTAPVTRRLPDYARAMLEAARAHNRLLAAYIQRGPELSEHRYYQELAQIMGGSMNAALNLRRSGTDEALGHLGKRPAPAAGSPDGLWLNSSLGRFTIDENYREGFGGLSADQSGLTAGYDLAEERYWRAGLFAGLAMSKMKSDWQKIESEALEAGAYGQLYLPRGFIFKAAASYSWQSHQSDRDIDLQGTLGESFKQKLRADFSGDSLNFQAELKRPLVLSENFRLTPSLGYLYQGVLLEPFLEASDKNAWPEYDLSTISGGTDFNVQQLKAGAEGLWRGECFTVSAGLHWLQNLGDLRPESQAVFAYAADPKIFTMYGAELDRQMLNLELGVDWSPEDTPINIGLAYEGVGGGNTQSHNLNVNISYHF